MRTTEELPKIYSIEELPKIYEITSSDGGGFDLLFNGTWKKAASPELNEYLNVKMWGKPDA